MDFCVQLFERTFKGNFSSQTLPLKVIFMNFVHFQTSMSRRPFSEFTLLEELSETKRLEELEELD